eukprot:2537350-Pleurochrysis_carterae.AAC.1
MGMGWSFELRPIEKSIGIPVAPTRAFGCARDAGSRAQPEHERPSVPIVDVRRLRESALAAQELRHAAARARELPRAAAARAALRRRPLPHHPLGVRAQRARVCRGLPQQVRKSERRTAASLRLAALRGKDGPLFALL